MAGKMRLLGDMLAAHGINLLGLFIVVLIDRLRRRLQTSKQDSQRLEVQSIIKEIPMNKPFDLANLAERLKAIGLPVAEDMLQAATKEIFAWAGESCVLKGGFFAVAVPLLPLVAAQVDALEDKLDGQVGK